MAGDQEFSVDPNTGVGHPALEQDNNQGPAGDDNNPASGDSSTTDEGAEGNDGESGADGAERKFTQAELDKIVQRRTAQAEARAERRVMRTFEKLLPHQQQPAQQAQPQTTQPKLLDFPSQDAYTDALVDWKLNQREAATRQRSAQTEQQQLYDKTEGFFSEAAKIPGFDRGDFEALPLTEPIARAVLDSDKAPQVMAYLASHPEVVDRIKGLSATRQVIEIGKLEDALPNRARASKAPAPVGPTGGRGGASTSGNPENMSMEAYAAMRKKQGAGWAR